MKSTASNGFYVQDVQEEDAAAFIKCFKDYPLSPVNTPILYEERVQLFSAALLFNERGTLPLTSDDPEGVIRFWSLHKPCLLYTSPSPRDATLSRMPSSA